MASATQHGPPNHKETLQPYTQSPQLYREWRHFILQFCTFQSTLGNAEGPSAEFNLVGSGLSFEDPNWLKIVQHGLRVDCIEDF